MPVGGDSEPPLYSAPVLRRGVPVVVTAAVAVAGLFALLIAHGSSTFSNAFATATFATVVLAGLALEIVLFLFLPTRIEVTEHQVRLVARRAVSTYDPSEMVLRRRTGDFEFVRKRTGRTLARFRVADAEAAGAAFAAVGVEVAS